MDIFLKIAEEKIREAQAKGEFDNLPGKGKPLNLDEDNHIPQELRIAYKILKNSGYIPPELQMQKEINTTLDLLKHCTDEREKYKKIQKLNLLITKMNMARKVPVNLEQDQFYYEKIVDKVKVKNK
ncbi:DnaJ family domain-containing protein [Desulfovulcanus sp.]